MTAAADDRDEMGATDMLTDDAIEAFLAGEPHAGWQDDAALSAIDHGLADLAALPAPPLRTDLARLMHPAPAPAPVTLRPVVAGPSTPPVPARPHSARRYRRIAAGLGAGLAVAGVALPVAAATHVLPAPAHRAVVQVLEAVTPFEIETRPAPPADVPPATTVEPAAGPTALTTRPASAPAPEASPVPTAVPSSAPGGPPPSTPAGTVPGPPAGVVPGGPPAAVDPGPPAAVDPGPPAGITPGPPAGITPGPPGGVVPGGPPAGVTPGPASSGARGPR